MSTSTEMLNCYIPLMKELGMSWNDIKATPKLELNGLIGALQEYNVLHSFDGYSEGQVADMAKQNPEVRQQWADYKEKRRKYVHSEKKQNIKSFSELM